MPTISASSPASLSGAEAVLAIHGAVAPWLKRQRRLHPARRTHDRCSLECSPPVGFSPRSLPILSCLTTRLAAFRNRITTFLKKFLIRAWKREFLSTIATGQLQILGHKILTSGLSLYSTLRDRHRPKIRDLARTGEWHEPARRMADSATWFFVKRHPLTAHNLKYP